MHKMSITIKYRFANNFSKLFTYVACEDVICFFTFSYGLFVNNYIADKHKHGSHFHSNHVCLCFNFHHLLLKCGFNFFSVNLQFLSVLCCPFLGDCSKILFQKSDIQMLLSKLSEATRVIPMVMGPLPFQRCKGGCSRQVAALWTQSDSPPLISHKALSEYKGQT